MIGNKTQLLLIYSTLTCLFIVLASLVHVHLIWLAIPFAFVLIQYFITLWLPGESWFKKTNSDEFTTIKEQTQVVVMQPTKTNTNSPTFENYQHIKKILAIHQARFPNAQVHNPLQIIEQNNPYSNTTCIIEPTSSDL